jgi:hypothetical protein
VRAAIFTEKKSGSISYSFLPLSFYLSDETEAFANFRERPRQDLALDFFSGINPGAVSAFLSKYESHASAERLCLPFLGCAGHGRLHDEGRSEVGVSYK